MNFLVQVKLRLIMRSLKNNFLSITVLVCLVMNANVSYASSYTVRCNPLIRQLSFDVSFEETYAVCKTAAEQGDADAQYNLGLMYFDGYGVSKDDIAAVKWFRAAAEQVNVNAQYFLGMMYASGDGLIQNHLKAHMWFNIAEANGSFIATASRNHVSQLMSNEQITQAQKLARQCLNSNYTDCGY